MSRSSDNSSHTRKEKARTIRELVYNLRDAVVSIIGQAILLDEHDNKSLVSYRGNGFFIKGHYIVCPASLTLISPDLLAKHHRDESTSTIGTCPNKLVRVSRILVDVSNVNGSGKSYCYDANIIGIDGAANIAILRINTTTNNPIIRVCHPFLQWGKSRNASSGDNIMLIGNTSAPGMLDNCRTSLAGAENGVVLGTLGDNRYTFPTGHVPGELLLLSNMSPIGQQGLPIILIHGLELPLISNYRDSSSSDSGYYGSVIGMTVHVEGSHTYNIGLSEFFIRRSVKALIKSHQDNSISDRYMDFINIVPDELGNYYRFNKGWLGLAGVLMDSQDYTTNFNGLQRVPCQDIRGDTCREIVGYRILAIASPDRQDGIFIPGNVPTNSIVPDLPPSPLYGIIECGDIITHVNNCPLGDRKGQISPTLVMWRVKPGSEVTITYKKEKENFAEVHNVNVSTLSYQPFLDFPFYSDLLIPFHNMLPTLL